MLVLHDRPGLSSGHGRVPRVVRDVMAAGGDLAAAVRRDVAAVKDGSFADPVLHGY